MQLTPPWWAGEVGRIMNPQAGSVLEEQHRTMITTKDGAQIYYKDWGQGQPIVFSHGWPLSADDWDTQMQFFLKHGYRVIAHDRRGHGPPLRPVTAMTWIT